MVVLGLDPRISPTTHVLLAHTRQRITRITQTVPLRAPDTDHTEQHNVLPLPLWEGVGGGVM
jgi:hypothetical protein